jgi:hypothetical protein
MKNDLFSLLIKFSTKWVVITGFIIFFAFSFFFLPGQNKIVETYSAGTGSPDTSFLYTPTELYQMAGAYGAEGRSAYIRARWTFDLAFPIIYTFFLTTSISWSANRVLKEGNDLHTGNLLPLFAMLFDLCENICTTWVFARYPAYNAFLSMLAPAFTLLKWICVGSSFLFLTAMLLWLLLDTQKKK